MKLSDALKELLYVARMSQQSVCEAAGFKNSISIRKPMERGDMRVSTLIRFANAAGYDLMMVKRGSVGTVPPIVIDCEDVDESGSDD